MFYRCMHCAAAALFIFAGFSRFGYAAVGELSVAVADFETQKPVAVRMHLKDSAGKPVIPEKTVAWKDHFVFDGQLRIDLPAGRYTFELDRGPEFHLRQAGFEIEPGQTTALRIKMRRLTDMKKEGWWSGELHVHRPLEDVELLMWAEDLHVAPVITWWNNRNLWSGQEIPADLLVRFDGNRFYHRMAGEDERGGGALLYFNLRRPLPLAGAQREYPSPVEFLRGARQHEGVHVDIEKPFWWDMPVWVATGQCDSIGLCNNHQWRDGMLPSEAWGKPRDVAAFPPPRGNGLWSEYIYHQLLECGLRIPPSAGSASGVLKNPVGYNRAYVHCGEQLSYEKWFEGLRAGRVVVTNGPLLRVRIGGKLPGHLFRAAAGGAVEVDIDVKLDLRDRVEHLEVVQNGQVIQRVPLEKWQAAGGRLPSLRLEESGWLLVRAVTDNRQTYRFASTGPYYVEIDGRPRISKRAVEFFQQWVADRSGQIELKDPAQRQSVLKHHRSARKFWQDLADRANAP